MITLFFGNDLERTLILINFIMKAFTLIHGYLMVYPFTLVIYD